MGCTYGEPPVHAGSLRHYCCYATPIEHVLGNIWGYRQLEAPCSRATEAVLYLLALPSTIPSTLSSARL